VSQQQRADNVSIDDIPVDIDNTQSGEVNPTDVPDEIESITRGLAGEHPPTNPLVVLKAARWWYIHGRAGPTLRSGGLSNGCDIWRGHAQRRETVR